ncbi:MAG: hypothetical protein LBR15_00620 [Methanobrevibacter sp.]|jgi:hypothetical protein|nr:hypothetical protein [Candidatus Methanovirga australis]
MNNNTRYREELLSEIELLKDSIREIQDDTNPDQLDRPLGLMYMIYEGLYRRREVLRNGNQPSNEF